MKNKEYIDLGLKYGGYMAQDRVFLENRLANLDDEKEKMLLVTPPSSVINAYFAELYQKRSPQDATDFSTLCFGTRRRLYHYEKGEF